MIELGAPVVLASSSVTRRALLAGLVRDFEVVEPGVDESAFDAPSPRSLTLALAGAKARDVAARRPDAVVIGADTMVVCRDEIIGKPADADDARRILRMLTTNPHKVVTAVCVIAPGDPERCAYVETGVRMKPMSELQIDDYLADPGTMDRAGAYALEPDDPLLEGIDGSMSCVMGLPMEALEGLLLPLAGDAEGER